MNEAQRQQARYNWLRVKDVAVRLGVSAWHVRNYIASGQLRARNVGTGKRPDYRFLSEWVDTFEEKRDVNA